MRKVSRWRNLATTFFFYRFRLIEFHQDPKTFQTEELRHTFDDITMTSQSKRILSCFIFNLVSILGYPISIFVYFIYDFFFFTNFSTVLLSLVLYFLQQHFGSYLRYQTLYDIIPSTITFNLFVKERPQQEKGWFEFSSSVPNGSRVPDITR